MPGGPKCIKRSVKELKASFFSKISLIKWQKHNQIAASHALDACDETQNLHNWCVLTLKVYLSMSSHKLHLFTGFWSGRWAEVQQISQDNELKDLGRSLWFIVLLPQQSTKKMLWKLWGVHLQRVVRPCWDFYSRVRQNLCRKFEVMKNWQVKGSSGWYSKQVNQVLLRTLGANKIFYLHSLNFVAVVLK